jgi:hypothetical protein
MKKGLEPRRAGWMNLKAAIYPRGEERRKMDAADGEIAGAGAERNN